MINHRFDILKKAASYLRHPELNLFESASFHHAFMMLMFIIVFGNALIFAISVYSSWATYSYLSGASLVIFIVSLFLARLNHFKIVTALIITTIYGTTTYAVVNGLGMYDVAVHLYYIVLTLAAILLTRTIFFLILAITLVFMIVLNMYFDATIIHTINPDQKGDPYIIIVVMLVTSTLIHILTGIIKNSYLQIRSDSAIIADKSAQLTDLLQKYLSIYDNIQDNYFEIGDDGLIKYVSPEIAHSLGYTPDELQGQPCRICFYDQPNFEKIILLVKEKGRIRDVSARMKSKEGVPVYFQFTMALLSTNTGENSGITGTAYDVTQAKLIEDHLQHTQKVESLGLITGSLVHDFNNLLAVIMANANLLSGSIKPHDSSHEYLDGIIDACKKASILSRKVLSFSRKDEVHTNTLRLNDIIAESYLIAKRLIQNPVTVSQSLGENVPDINADPTHIEQILLNLIVNAQDALLSCSTMPKTIDIGTAYVPQAQAVLVNPKMTHSSGYAVITITDNGPGMSEQIKKKIFEPFFTTKQQEKGTGLGLAIVQGIVEKNGGTITVESSPDKGCTFKIYWPAVRQS